MTQKIVLLKLVTLALYAGPLLAGLSGHGWTVLPAFVATFVLWQVVMRPADWPAGLQAWRQPGASAGAMLRVLALVTLVAAMFGIGRGIGAVAGALSSVPLAAALGLSMMAVPLARLLWDPATAAQMEGFPDTEIAAVRAAPAGGGTALDGATAIRPLLMLPADTPEPTLRAGLEAILAEGHAPARWRALAAALTEAPGAHAELRRTFVTWATEPEVSARWEGRGLLADAFRVAGDDPALLRTYADRAERIAEVWPDSWRDFPAPELRREVARRCRDAEVARRISALSSRIDAMAPAGATA